MKRFLKRYQKSFLVAALVCAAVAFVWYGRYTVASGEKFDSFSGVRYGYQVQQYYCWNNTRITIWNARGSLGYQMDAVYEFGQLTVEKVVEERWLENDLAIYLNLEIKYHDSVISVAPARIIYDFHRGEMHTSTEYTLWRIRNKKNGGEDWMTDSEFDTILNRLSEKP